VSFVRNARILKSDAVGVPRPLVARPQVSEAARRRIAKEGVDATDLARRTLAGARAEASEIVRRAKIEAAEQAARVAEEAREAEVARLAAQFLAVRAHDERRAERDLERTVALARVLAERLLGEALEADPRRAVALARQALVEARGAKRVVIEACPLDVEALRSHVEEIGLPAAAIEIRAETSLSRGSLRLTTNLGTLDAQLTPQLERLAEALRDALA
jgi:flagellar biosynthesis/type III secretory pathway protein FliH